MVISFSENMIFDTDLNFLKTTVNAHNCRSPSLVDISLIDTWQTRTTIRNLPSIEKTDELYNLYIVNSL